MKTKVEREDKANRKKSSFFYRLFDGWTGVFFACFLALFFRWIIAEAYVIPSGSMLPSLLIHDHILVTKFKYGIRLPFSKKWLVYFRPPKRGEVVVFRYPEDESLFYVKRVIGIPGDKIFYEKGNLYVNDQLIEKKAPYDKKKDFNWLEALDVKGQRLSARDKFVHWEETLGEQNYSILIMKKDFRRNRHPAFGPYTVPKDSFFVMGDNRDNSLDSRLWSEKKRFVPRENIVGKGFVVFLSCTKSLPWFRFCDPRYLRWNRLFHSIH